MLIAHQRLFLYIFLMMNSHIELQTFNEIRKGEYIDAMKQI